MNNTKTTKRALLSSVLAMLICVAMLIGTTFAWFTDSASTAVNKIQAGTLDIELQYQKADSSWEDAEGKTLNFKKAVGHESEAILWEPGCTYELPAIRIKNNGNLALKYELAITGIKGDAKLNEAIEWTNGTNELLSQYEGTMIPGQHDNVTDPIVIKGHMKPDAGNEYQGLSIDGIGITVVATQLASEYDSTRYTYDTDATYLNTDADGHYLISNANELVYFAKSVNVDGETYTGKTVKLTADIDLAGKNWIPVGQTSGYSAANRFQGTFDGQYHTIKNLTIPESSWEAGNDDGKNFATGFFGFIDVGGQTIKNVTFDNATVGGHHWVGVVAGYMTGTIEKVVVKNSTVTSTYKTSEADGDKAGGVTGCLNSGSVTDCRVENSTVTAVRDCGSIVGFSTTNGNVTGNTAQDCTVYYSTNDTSQIGGEIAGKRANGVSGNTANNVTVTKLVTVSTASELSAALNKTYTEDTTVMLTKDIDLAGVNWESPTMSYTSSGETITINGNGYTIKNLTSTDNQYGGLIGKLNTNGTVIIKDIKLENVKLRGTNVDGECAGGALIGWMDCHGDYISIENVTVTGVDIDGFKYTGGLVGYRNDTVPMNITSCTVTGTDTAKTINSSYNENGNYKGHIGGLVGYYGKGTMSACTLNNIAITRSGVAQSERAGVLVGTLESGASVTSATVSNVTLLGIPVTSASNMVGPGASKGSVSGVTVQ